MVLTYQEYRTYLDAHFKLLYYCYLKKNDKEKNLTFGQFIKKPWEAKLEARNYLFDNISLLNEYLNYNKQVTASEKETLMGFSRNIGGRFIIVKQLKNYAVFLDIESGKYYAVLALWDPFPVIIDSIPVLVRATLLPFNGKIIYDGFMIRQAIIGKNMEKSLLDNYREAKAKNLIIKSIG
jgi:hypothetical protein